MEERRSTFRTIIGQDSGRTPKFDTQSLMGVIVTVVDFISVVGVAFKRLVTLFDFTEISQLPVFVIDKRPRISMATSSNGRISRSKRSFHFLLNVQRLLGHYRNQRTMVYT